MSGMDIKQLAEAYIAEKAMERTQRYLADGRMFADLDDEGLTKYFVSVFREYILFDGDRRWDAIAEVQCEFELRGLNAPIHRVAADLALFKERLEQFLRAIPCDPATLQEVRDELADLRERLALPKN